MGFLQPVANDRHRATGTSVADCSTNRASGLSAGVSYRPYLLDPRPLTKSTSGAGSTWWYWGRTPSAKAARREGCPCSLIPDRDEASFDLKFQGRTHTRTVGTNGPALIYCHTDTGFVCTRPVSFDQNHGFVAEASTIVAKTKLVYDGFGSSRDGLGRRLISRMAERALRRIAATGAQIAARDIEHKLLSAFDQQVNAQLAAMNQQLNIVLYTNLFVGKGLAKQLAARSSKDCIHIGVLVSKGVPATNRDSAEPRACGTDRDLGSLGESC